MASRPPATSPQGDHEVYVTIQAFSDEVLVEADTPSKRLCRRLV